MSFCPKCGKEVTEGASFCPNCGQSLTVSATPTVSTTPQPLRIPESFPVRPTGISIIAGLEVLGGLFFLGIGALLFFAGAFVSQLTALIPGVVVGTIGVVLIIFGLVTFFIAYGVWNGRGWAWTVGVVFAALGLIMGLMTLPGGIVTLLVDGLIIYYLTRPHVKKFFGKEPVPLSI